MEPDNLFDVLENAPDDDWVRHLDPQALKRLEKLVQEGLNSGTSIPVTPQFWEEMWARFEARRAARNLSREQD